MIAQLLAAAALAVAPEPAPFEVLDVGLDLQTLTIAREGGPCYTDEDLSVVENRETIRIRAVRTFVEGCAAPASYSRTVVPLRRRVGGRGIEGEPRLPAGTFRPRLVPTVLDMRAADAVRALRTQDFEPRRIGHARGAVAFQSPLPGRRAEDHRVIRLTIGRGLFRTRALRRCIAHAGVQTGARRPEPGDADAPDAVVDVFAGPARGFVGLYADRLRGRELLRMIRGNARGIDGTVEHRGHVTILWAGRPAAAVRDRVRRCAYGRLGRPRSSVRAAQSQASR
jgi:hypothetical protein